MIKARNCLIEVHSSKNIYLPNPSWGSVDMLQRIGGSSWPLWVAFSHPSVRKASVNQSCARSLWSKLGLSDHLCVLDRVISMCKYFQESVKKLSLDYYNTLRRHNYVTPTSYLELILTFKTLLNKKRQEVDMMRNRYLTGLQKLEFAASQVITDKIVLGQRSPELIGCSEALVQMQKSREHKNKDSVWPCAHLTRLT